MRRLTLFLALFIYSYTQLIAQTPIYYEISFKNAHRHEARISVEFNDVQSDTLQIRMSRTSPGRYAIHEFAKNIYAFSAVDQHGKSLKIDRPNPYQWNVSGYDSKVKISYTLFANRGDGTYSQIDETHAHINTPATFVYAPAMNQRKIQLKVNNRLDLNWKIATQLQALGKDTFEAPNLSYFFDSPIEISHHQIRSFELKSNDKIYTISFVLHELEETTLLDDYMEWVQRIAKKEIEVYGELPDFDFGRYTFLACYTPQVNGDGMEHRNSTILTSTQSLAEGGFKNNISTVAHEFFHAWNVERIRPKSLEPFNFDDANIAGELWFSEGFTSYYTLLTLCRAGIISKEDYVSRISGPINTVMNSPRKILFFSG